MYQPFSNETFCKIKKVPNLFVSENCIVWVTHQGSAEWRSLSYPTFPNCSNEKELQRDSCFPQHAPVYRIHQLPVSFRNQFLQSTTACELSRFPHQGEKPCSAFTAWPSSWTACLCSCRNRLRALRFLVRKGGKGNISVTRYCYSFKFAQG